MKNYLNIAQSLLSRVGTSIAEAMQQARETNTAAEQLGRELAQEASGIGRARLAQDKRDARARGISLPEHRATAAAYEMAQNVGPEEVANLQRLIGAGIAPTQTLGQVQQAQAPQGQVQQAAGFNQTNKTVDEQLNASENRDHYSNSVEAAQAEVGEESQQGGEEPPTDNRRLQQMMDRIGRPGGEK